MKKILFLSLFFVIIAAGCGTGNDPNEEAEEVNGDGKGINEGVIAGSLEEQSPLTYQYRVSNQTENEVKHEFSSSQRFDYSIADSSGEQVFLLSSVTSYIQVMGEEIIEPGGELVYDIDLQERDLPPGKYVLTAWLTPTDGKKYEVKQEFTVSEGE
ncbi:BsuPI-related putative proteinase inhibitor [Sediminibacillus albus]|uniref:Intracellular proteinase inhibitor n=1 Tax=Sediminibacillus albus TaxID=407036 RepID=A0A1G8WJA9_9BACI|nr:BsuPI-related putative proteinase inhibitor [Sediminibacillus albus]SDJ78217.1 Intracellular proteinase inhibitor [Sediminibacillus albus]